jgi:hypothetical protein
LLSFRTFGCSAMSWSRRQRCRRGQRRSRLEKRLRRPRSRWLPGPKRRSSGGWSLARSSASGTNLGVTLLRPRAGLRSSGDSWLRLRSDQPRCLLGSEPWRRSWLRWPKRGAGVLLRGGYPSARVAVRGRARFRRRWKRRRGCCCSLCRCLNLQEQFVCSMHMFFAATEAQTSYCRVIKMCFLSSCFEYQ